MDGTAAVELIVDGKSIRVLPLGATVLGTWTDKLTARRLADLPSIASVLRDMAGLEAEAIREAIRTIAELRSEASEPTLEDFLSWVTNDLTALTGVIADCIAGDAVDSVTCDDIFRSILAEMRAGDDFVNRWLAASGLV